MKPEPEKEKEYDKEPEKDGASRGETIRLDDYLKLTGYVRSGGEAKHRIQAGDVQVNGEVVLHRSRQVRRGDLIAMDGKARPAEW